MHEVRLDSEHRASSTLTRSHSAKTLIWTLFAADIETVIGLECICPISPITHGWHIRLRRVRGVDSDPPAPPPEFWAGKMLEGAALDGLAAPHLIIFSQVISHDIVQVFHITAPDEQGIAPRHLVDRLVLPGAVQLVLMMSANIFQSRLPRHTARRAAARRRGREDGGRVRLPGLLRVPTVLHVSSPASPEPLPPPSRGHVHYQKRANPDPVMPPRAVPSPPTDADPPSNPPIPPLHRIQPTPETQRKQIELWKSLILRCAHSSSGSSPRSSVGTPP